jgi:hypothetical protein
MAGPTAPRPHRQIGGGQQVDGAAWTERLDQGAVLPERALDVGAGRPGDAPPDRQLGGAEDLRVGSAQHAGDLGRAQVRRRSGQGLAGHPPGRDTAPGQRGQGRGLGGHGPTFCLARPTSVTSGDGGLAPAVPEAGRSTRGPAPLEAADRSSGSWTVGEVPGGPRTYPIRMTLQNPMTWLGYATLIADTSSGRFQG